MQAIDRELSGAITGLQVLAASPSLMAGDFRAFHAQARSAVGIAGNSVIILYDRQGNRLLSTAAQFGERLPRREDISSFAPPFETGKPYVTPLFVSYSVKQPTLGILVPVVVRGEVRYVLGAGLLSARLSHLVTTSGLRSEWVAAVLDQHGTIIARTRAAERFVGTKALPPVWQRIQAQSGQAGRVEGDTKEGDRAMLAFARSGQSGWYTVVAIPTDALTGQLYQSLWLVGLSAAAVLLLAAILVRWGLQQITQPLARLEHMARALEDGRRVHAAPTGIEQFDRLAHTLARAGLVIGERHDELRQEHEQKDRFIATLAHELRNPLAPIRTGVQILSRQPPPAVASRTLATMDRELTNMVRLIDDLLDVSRVARGTLVLRKEPTDLHAVIRDAVASTEPHIRSGGQNIALELPPEPIHANVDPARTCQILVNLLQNAAKFSPAGGSIRLQLHATADAAEITVTDTGRGIPANELERIFELFYQVRDETGAAAAGLGIGLSLSRELARMQGGDLTAESAGPGHGATFRLRMADVRPAGSETVVALRRVTGASKALHVMVVDDNVDAAETLATALRLEGHSVYVANDGATAINIARQVQADIVLLDIGMPGMDGYAVCQTLREFDSYRTTRIVALTGWGAARDRERAVQAGFDAHVTKPADWPQIEAALSTGTSVPRTT